MWALEAPLLEVIWDRGGGWKFFCLNLGKECAFVGLEISERTNYVCCEDPSDYHHVESGPTDARSVWLRQVATVRHEQTGRVHYL